MRPLEDMEAEIIIMLSGIDETLADVIYARHSYTPEEILSQRRFVDVISITDSGRRMVDLNHFRVRKQIPLEPTPLCPAKLQPSSSLRRRALSTTGAT